ncbi:DUF1800 domain-containing protein [Zhongshania aquimaris]|uniref:DUF1800 domain-containing protein n=1 Tax=Zhongshania aquimaris TaxID=2857107 RepID=A0ABS6VRG6_9GAMM|nr:DUF1800 domain-containing protein [Zhongshania aquimaris]MBW2940866.1 DUF1800 domain-containing protein [Zhongshania aquimaris]
MKVLSIEFYGVLLALLFASCYSSLSFSLTFAEARHLSLRAGFGPESELINRLLPLGKGKAITYLLQRREKDFSVPPCAQETLIPYMQFKDFDDEKLMAFRQSQNKCKNALKQAYASHLLSNDSNDVLLHRMELFWHNHFTSSLAKVPYAALMYEQHNTIHKNALGSFRVLLHSVIRDPAMIMYLDNNNNNKAKPNENLGRELLELFTLGVGNYSEKDVKEVARALTGLSIDNANFVPRFYPERHDYAKKTILGQTGYFGLDAVLEILLSKPEVAKYITRKLWLEFVSEADDKAISRLASEFYQDWNISRLIRGILMSQAFWDDAGNMTKSPLELVVGGARLLPGMVPSKSVPNLVNRMGQNIFDPPNVKGWPIGSDWINSKSYVERVKFTEQLTRGLQPKRYKKSLSFLCERGASELAASPVLVTPASAKITDIAVNGEACVDDLARVFEHPAWQLK